MMMLSIVTSPFGNRSGSKSLKLKNREGGNLTPPPPVKPSRVKLKFSLEAWNEHGFVLSKMVNCISGLKV